MEQLDIEYICRFFTTLSGISVRIFDGEALRRSFFSVPLPRDPMEIYRDAIFAIEDHIGYYITPNFHVYGVVNSGDTRIVMGPTAQVVASDPALRELAFQADVPKEDVPSFVEGMKAMTRLPLETLLMMLCPVNYLLNGEKLEFRDIMIRQETQQELKRRVEQKRTQSTYEKAPTQSPNNTLSIEEMLTGMVRRGDIEALKAWFSQIPAVRGGVLADNQLRQLKNTFIVSATLVSRAAIRGGMDQEEAFSLSDAYIQRMEQLSTQDGITNLQYNMVLEFAEQVEKLRWGAASSRLALEVAGYVRRHLSEPIHTGDLAKEFYLTRTHFSAKFKQETGVTLTDFILGEKTEEGKRLLRYSDKSVAAIAAYLGFSSHGHFNKVFKKYAGLTPQEYRRKYS